MNGLTQKELDMFYESIYAVMKEKSTMSETAFDLWFSEFHLISVSDEKVVLATPDNFKRRTIVNKYLDLVTKSVCEALDYEPKVEVICDAGFRDSTLPTQKSAPTKGIFAPDKEQEEVENQLPVSIGLNPEYTFENFVVGTSNQHAYACSIAVANDPNGEYDYNPLFIYGPSGLGKTHLMYAIANEVHKQNPDKIIISVKSEDFLNDMLDCIARKNMKKFREKYRKADMLLIDDIQFISGKVSTQEEFFHTFDALYCAKKQIVLTSDRPPKEMYTLEDRIRTRFSQGIIVDVQPPEYELRLAILKRKAEKGNIDIPNDVIIFLAERLNSNIREIEGALKKIGAVSLIHGKPVTLDMVKSSIPDYFRENKPVAETVNTILEVTARKYDVSVEAILGKSRTKQVKTARNVAMFIIKKVLDQSLEKIGQMMDRDHSTVHSNIKAIEAEIQTNDKLNNEILEIMAEVKS